MRIEYLKSLPFGTHGCGCSFNRFQRAESAAFGRSRFWHRWRVLHYDNGLTGKRLGSHENFPIRLFQPETRFDQEIDPMTPAEFVAALRRVQFESVFNPYRDICDVHDVANAPNLRRKALLGTLDAACSAEVDAIWIGRDLGYRGGRRTGLALTDDVNLERHGARWGIRIINPVKGARITERTAAVVWKALSGIDSNVFLWNVFPFHPHLPGKPFTNRAHRAHERRVGEQMLSELVRLLKPRHLVSLGNDAAAVVNRHSGELKHVSVRHPGFGGNNLFLVQIRALYSSN